MEQMRRMRAIGKWMGENGEQKGKIEWFFCKVGLAILIFAKKNDIK